MLTLQELLAKCYGPATGPFGFPMGDAHAKEVETLFKGLPKECQDLGFQRVNFVPKASELVEGERADVSFISTDSTDRDREVLIPKGFDWSQFKKNPVVPFAHDYRALPVGRCAWWKPGEQKGVSGWLAKTLYTPKPAGWTGDWFPDAVYHLVQQGVLRGKSVGFITTECSSPTPKEVEADPRMANVRMVYRKIIVLEYSVAPVQSNPDSVVLEVGKMKAKGITVPDLLMEHLGIGMPDEPPAIDWGTGSKGATQDPPASDPATPIIKAWPAHVTYEQVAKSLQERVAKGLDGLTADAIVKEALARRSGKV